MAAEFSEHIQSLLYGKMEVEFADPTFSEQLEIVRALTANPSAVSRLRIKGTTQHPWIIRLLSGFEAAAKAAAQTAQVAVDRAAAQTARAAVDQAAARTPAVQSLPFSR